MAVPTVAFQIRVSPGLYDLLQTEVDHRKEWNNPNASLNKLIIELVEEALNKKLR